MCSLCAGDGTMSHWSRKPSPLLSSDRVAIQCNDDQDEEEDDNETGATSHHIIRCIYQDKCHIDVPDEEEKS